MTAPWIIAAVILLAAHYIYLIGSAAVGFVRVAGRRGGSNDRPTVSVLIPARNEEKSIEGCLESVLANDYPSDRVEIIVVDDGSTDRTGELVRTYQYVHAGGMMDEREPVRLIRLDHLEGGIAHKKRALARAVEEATGEIILTTDADCTVPEGWIGSMVSYFEGDVGMVTGPVLYRRWETVLARLQSLEFLGLVALGAGLVGIGRPHLCNSANLAYRRRAYDDVGGYSGLEGVTTGDDEMLLHRMAYESAWQVRSCMDPGAAVETDPNRTLREFFLQRKRWASAHARYAHLRLTITSILCYLFYLSIPAALLFWSPYLFWGTLAAKIMAEACLLFPAAKQFDRGPLMALLVPAQVVYIPYILAIGIAGTLGGYTWKGRKVR